MQIGYLHLKIHFPGCRSLKEKRSRLKPILVRVRREFNVAAAEIDHQDVWQTTAIGIVTLSGSGAHTRRSLEAIPRWIENRWPDLLIELEEINLIG